MFEQSLFGNIKPFCPFFSIVTVGVNGYPTSRGKHSPDFFVLGIHQLNKIFHDDIHAVFMNIAMVSKAE